MCAAADKVVDVLITTDKTVHNVAVDLENVPDTASDVRSMVDRRS
jgi:hypothetical protein